MSSQAVGTIDSKEFQFEWKVRIDEDFIDTVSGEIISSPTLVTKTCDKEIKWCIELLPRGCCGDEEHVAIYLKNLSVFKVEASGKFSLLIKDDKLVIERQMSRSLFERTSCLRTWGFDDFLKQSSIAELRNKRIAEVTIQCRITIYGIRNPDQRSCARSEMLDDFERILVNEKYSDLTVISADEGKLHLHKNILAIRSPVFEAMFERDMVEKKKNVVDIKDIKYGVLLEMFRFMYCGKVYDIQTMVCDLLRAAEKYAVDGLKLLCEETMLLNLCVGNAIEYLIAADLNNSANSKIIREFIVKNPKEFVNKPEFKSLGVSHLDLMFEIMNDIVYGDKSV